MSLDTSHRARTIVRKIQGLLKKIDGLRLPSSSRRDVQSILVRQVSKELDRALPSQRGHGQRTACLALRMGTAIGVSHEALHDLALAALLHDIGLLTLPPDLFRESSHWDSEIYAAAQCHPRSGAELLEPFHFLREASVLIAHHHERWDGTGYPYGLRGLFIPIGARILAIADAFDAISVPEADGPEVRDRVAYRILRVAAGSQFDPDLIERCGHCLAGDSSRPIAAEGASRQDDLFDHLQEEPT